MMEFLPMKTLVVSHVTLVMSQLVVTLGLVRVMRTGVVLMLHVKQVPAIYFVFLT